MASARKIIVFPFYSSYFTTTAVIIYQVNLLKTLKGLPDAQKPVIRIWHNHISPLEEIKAIDYPYVEFVNIKSPLFRFMRLRFLLAQKTGLLKLVRFHKAIDSIYPAYPDPFIEGIKEKIYWKADFQENYYPQYFLPSELAWNEYLFEVLAKHPQSKLVLSSHDAHKDLQQFYPQVKNPVCIFRFVSHIPPLNDAALPAVKEKFGVQKPYFIVCNQFWPHKNHIAILHALIRWKKAGELPCQFVFTGKTASIRSKEYFPMLQQMITDNGLEQDVVITDFLDRSEQLLLMKHSLAVVQPTLFEGWSTVIEDAKALNKYVIASGIAVNREQLLQNVSFFDPHDDEELADILAAHVAHPPATVLLDYSQNIRDSLQDVVAIFGLA
jgi:Glycosyl transferases group 1